MENEHVINGLLRRRQEIADALEQAQGKVRQLVLDIDALDATIRLFQPEIEIGIVRVRPPPRRHQAMRGENSRMLLDILRDADGPIGSRDLVLRVMALRGLNAADKWMCDAMRGRVGASLGGLKERGRVVSAGGNGARGKVATGLVGVALNFIAPYTNLRLCLNANDSQRLPDGSVANRVGGRSLWQNYQERLFLATLGVMLARWAKVLPLSAGMLKSYLLISLG